MNNNDKDIVMWVERLPNIDPASTALKTAPEPEPQSQFAEIEPELISELRDLLGHQFSEEQIRDQARFVLSIVEEKMNDLEDSR